MDDCLSQVQLIYNKNQYVLAYENTNKNLYKRLNVEEINFLNSNFKIEVYDS
jgi:hypothetical protein